MNQSFLSILNQYWKFDSFRPLQQEIIESVFNEVNTLALMPTGGGKSLCYQIPALAKPGICLVVSPLIALMKDQVANLRKKNITAFAIYSGMTRKEIINILQIATNSNCKFLYVSPERLETNLFKEYLPGIHVNLIAIDEAHCISQWGYDFRPSYLKIAELRNELPDVPILALTASATKEVQKDICKQLQFKKEKIFRQSFHRPNLSYSIFNTPVKINRLIEILNNVSGSSIVYCRNRKRTQEISNLLLLQNIDTDFYHAGMKQELRNKKQEDWIQNKIRVLVCTTAFGMGIDKPDVRTVVHVDVPDSLENYYQEAGRAGRDGKKSYAILLYNEKDIEELNNQVEIRFPSFAVLKKVYESVVNYLQIPSHSGEGQYFEFDRIDFTKKFKLNTLTVFYALKTLEQEEWLTYNEQVQIPATVKFCTDKNYLYEFEKTTPRLEPIIKTLLRSYEGIFDYPASISEYFLAQQLQSTVDTIKTQLIKLNQLGIIEYAPQKDKPQLFLLRNRVPVSDFYINTNFYRHRKEKYIDRIKNMVAFINETAICRSKFIGNYFGDLKINNCEICDNCLRYKKTKFSKIEFEKINSQIQLVLKTAPISSKKLLLQLKEFKKEKILIVIEFLQAENKIEIDKTGLLKLK